MTEHAPSSFVPGPVKLRAEDFFALGDAGALSDYPKTELIDGAIIASSPQHSRHGRVQRAIFLALHHACEEVGGLEAAFEISVVLGPHNVVQPDVMGPVEPAGAGADPGRVGPSRGRGGGHDAA